MNILLIAGSPPKTLNLRNAAVNNLRNAAVNIMRGRVVFENKFRMHVNMHQNERASTGTGFGFWVCAQIGARIQGLRHASLNRMRGRDIYEK